MTTSHGPDLRELLHDLADDQPPAAVPGDTWARGRRAHRRGVALTAGASVAAVALVSVGAVGISRGLDESRSGTPDVAGRTVTAPRGALPTHVHALPAGGKRLMGDVAYWEPDFEAPSRAVGRLSVVFASDPGGDAGLVGVTATRGRYLGLDLPGFESEGTFRDDANVAALSADGTMLAYAWAQPGVPERSGVRVMDLRTGALTTHRITSDHGVLVSALSWSPDQRYVAFNVGSYADDSGTRITGAGSFTVRRLDTRTGEVVTVPGAQHAASATAVDDAGDVAVPGDRPVAWSSGAPRPRPVVAGTSSVAWDPAGRRLALGTIDGDVAVATERPRGAVFSSTPWQDGDPDLSHRVEVLGWVGKDTFAARADNDDRVLVLTEGGTSDPTELLTIDTAVQYPSVATDLLDRRPRDFAAPDWADPPWWSRVPVSTLALGGVGLAAAAVLGASVLRRRRAGIGL